MTKQEEKDLEALKIGFQMTEWEDFLLVLNEIRDRDKDIISMYRQSHIEMKEFRHHLGSWLQEQKSNENSLKLASDSQKDIDYHYGRMFAFSEAIDKLEKL